MAPREGMVRPPSALVMTTGSPPSTTAMAEFVVPRSIPIALGMGRHSFWAEHGTGNRGHGLPAPGWPQIDADGRRLFDEWFRHGGCSFWANMGQGTGNTGHGLPAPGWPQIDADGRRLFDEWFRHGALLSLYTVRSPKDRL